MEMLKYQQSNLILQNNIMKKSIIIFLFFISLSANAQGNLQFNRVIYYTIPSQSFTATGIIASVTIPEGKVWKIEAASHNAAGGTGWSLRIGNFLLYACTYIGGGGLNYHPDINFPIWLPSGAYNLQVDSYNGSGTFQGAGLSIIEFNIVP